jgi:PadR family transcriptional regulator PadR
VGSGTLYPALTRLEDQGWVTGEWEQIDESAAGRPARRYYRLTAAGVEAAKKARDELYASYRLLPEWRA